MIPIEGMTWSHSMARIKWIATILLVAGLYFACSRIGLTLAFAGTNATPFWPPAGIALALVVLYGPRMLPGIFLGATAASFYQSYGVTQTENLVWSSIDACGVGLGNSSEALLAYYLMRVDKSAGGLASVRGALWFVMAVLAGSLMAAAIGTLTLLPPAANVDFVVHFGLSWWLGDAVAMLVLTPLILLWSRADSFVWQPHQATHLFLFVTVFLLALNVSYSSIMTSTFPARFLVVMTPLLIWAAIAFGTREISLILFLLSSFSLYRTLLIVSGMPAADVTGVLLHLQVFVGVVAAVLLILNGAFTERRQARAQLQQLLHQHKNLADERVQVLEQQNHRLQDLIQKYSRSEKRLQESEDRLALITQATTEGIWEWQPRNQLFRYSTRFKFLLGYDQFDQLPQSLRFWLRRIEVADRAALLQACRNHLRERELLDVSFRMRNKSGELRWYRIRGQATWNARNEPMLLAGSIADVQGEKMAHDILLTEKRLLERMTSGAHLHDVLNQVAELLCARFIEAGCALSLVDESGVNPQLVAWRNLTDDVRQLSAKIKVGPQAVAASAAIYFNSQILIDDVTRHADWRPYMGLLRDTSLKACWALPIRNRHGSVLGGMALYFGERRYPCVDELEFLDRVARLAGIAVEQHSTRNTLQKSEQRYRELYHSNPAMFFSLDRDGVILSVNQFGAEHLGYEPAQLVERNYGELLDASARESMREALRMALETPGRVQVFEARKQRADGSALWVRDSLRAMGTPSGQSEVLVVAEDITDIRELSDRLAYHAAHDPLTGLYNRRKFEAELVNAIYEAEFKKSTHALCYLDLDLFKVINDTCGHAAGDELLRQLGRLLEETIADSGVIARLGGDEFGLLILDTDSDRVLQLAGMVRDQIAGYQFVWDRRPYHVGVSIGVVMIGQDSTNLTALMGAADSACYAAKDTGGSRIHLYHENDQELQRRRGEMQWVTRIPRGIRENRFALAIQEIVALDGLGDGERHFELLIRYRDNDGEWIQPGVFLPAAERYSLATMLDRWVFVQVTQLLQECEEVREQNWVFNVNLSGQSVTNDEFQQFLIQRIRDLHLPAHRICFEITETSTISNLSRAKSFIEALKMMGCRFALDDFGSGLSTFGYLKGLPVDYIKIDGQFVQDLENNDMNFAIVKSINEVGHVLGKQTVAECVETAACAERLRTIGVDCAQGYHLAVPVMLADWLRQMAIPYSQTVRQDQG